MLIDAALFDELAELRARHGVDSIAAAIKNSAAIEHAQISDEAKQTVDRATGCLCSFVQRHDEESIVEDTRGGPQGSSVRAPAGKKALSFGLDCISFRGGQRFSLSEHPDSIIIIQVIQSHTTSL